MWVATAPASEPLRPLVGDVTADIVIVGGGFTGVSSAYELSGRYPDKKIVLIEARRLASGASGRNGGMALNWINGVEVKHAERAKRVFEVTKSGIDWISDVIAKHKLDVRFRRDGCLECVTDVSRVEHEQQKAEKLASWGLPIKWLAGADLDPVLRARGVVGATLDPTAGQLHGVDLIAGLRGVLLERGVAIYEFTPASSIEEGKIITVHTPGGTVRAPAMVLATSAYSPALGYFKLGVLPLHSHVLSTEPLPKDLQEKIGWGRISGFSDDMDRIAYASLGADGRLVFGGGSNAAYAYRYGARTVWDGSRAGPQAAIRKKLYEYFPDLKDFPVSHDWYGVIGVTMSRVCSIGVKGAHKNVYYGLGYSGHGVVLANLAGKVICDLYSDNHEPWRDLPFYNKTLTGIPPEPFRWVGYQFYTAFTGKSPRVYEAP